MTITQRLERIKSEWEQRRDESIEKYGRDSAYRATCIIEGIQICIEEISHGELVGILRTVAAINGKRQGATK